MTTAVSPVLTLLASAVVAAAGEVQAAARNEDASKCKAALDEVEKAAAAVAALKPTGQPQAIPRIPPIRSLMLTMDETVPFICAAVTGLAAIWDAIVNRA